MGKEITFDEALMKMVAASMRERIIMEINAFANDYHHHVDGFDVVRVDQLLDFLKDVAVKNESE